MQNSAWVWLVHPDGRGRRIPSSMNTGPGELSVEKDVEDALGAMTSDFSQALKCSAEMEGELSESH